MQLINFNGLDCYTNCLITLAYHFGIDYKTVFHNLWSETDFYYCPYTKVFASRRLEENLLSLGMGINEFSSFDLSPNAKALSELPPKTWVIVGIDAFQLPWNPHYRRLNGSHCIFIKCSDKAELLGFDPTYGFADIAVSRELVENHAYLLKRIHRCRKTGLTHISKSEPAAIAADNSDLSLWLSRLFEKARQDGYAEIMLLSTYIDRLIRNRYLYNSYAEKYAPQIFRLLPPIDKRLFDGWYAVKNGLLMAAVGRSSANSLDESEALAQDLAKSERELAHCIVMETRAY